METVNDAARERGLVIISALLNFIDYLNSQGLMVLPEEDRGETVLQFLGAHSDDQNYFMCAERIAEQLGIPLKD